MLSGIKAFAEKAVGVATDLAQGVVSTLKHASYWRSYRFSNTVLVNPRYKSCENPIAIYCIHGTFDLNVAFLALANSLINEGEGLSSKISHVHLIDCQSTLTSKIEDFAEQLLKVILRNKDKNVILIGHSRGALIIAYLIAFLAQKNHINVIKGYTLAGPFGGSVYARLAFGLIPSIKQMEQVSPFLNKLNKKLMDVPNITYLEGTKDLLVPLGSAYPHGLSHRTKTFSANHLKIVSLQNVWDYLRTDINYQSNEFKPVSDSKIRDVNDSKQQNDPSDLKPNSSYTVVIKAFNNALNIDDQKSNPKLIKDISKLLIRYEEIEIKENFVETEEDDFLVITPESSIQTLTKNQSP